MVTSVFFRGTCQGNISKIIMCLLKKSANNSYEDKLNLTRSDLSLPTKHWYVEPANAKEQPEKQSIRMY